MYPTIKEGTVGAKAANVSVIATNLLGTPGLDAATVKLGLENYNLDKSTGSFSQVAGSSGTDQAFVEMKAASQVLVNSIDIAVTRAVGVGDISNNNTTPQVVVSVEGSSLLTTGTNSIVKEGQIITVKQSGTAKPVAAAFPIA
jgi:hypothetical protein